MALVPENFLGLKIGLNSFDLDGDGSADLDVLLRVRTGAHHSFTGYEFYVRGDRGRWHRIAKGLGLHDLREGRCHSSAVALFVDAEDRQKRVTLVHAERALGGVRFSLFRLVGQDGNESDQPAYRFEPAGTVKSKRLYCDVRKALDAELGVAAGGESASAGREQGLGNHTVLRIRNGLNHIDLDRDGIKDLVVAPHFGRGYRASRIEYNFLARVEFRPGVWEWHLVLSYPSHETRGRAPAA